MTGPRVVRASIPHPDPAQRGAARLLSALAVLSDPPERASLFVAIASLTYNADTDELTEDPHA